jgi:hypothetical protein
MLKTLIDASCLAAIVVFFAWLLGMEGANLGLLASWCPSPPILTS